MKHAYNWIFPKFAKINSQLISSRHGPYRLHCRTPIRGSTRKTPCDIVRFAIPRSVHGTRALGRKTIENKSSHRNKIVNNLQRHSRSEEKMQLHKSRRAVRARGIKRSLYDCLQQACIFVKYINNFCLSRDLLPRVVELTDR